MIPHLTPTGSNGPSIHKPTPHKHSPPKKCSGTPWSGLRNSNPDFRDSNQHPDFGPFPCVSYQSRYSLIHYPAGAATSDMRKREVYGRFERICSLSIHLHEGSRESWEIEPSKLLYRYSYQTTKSCPRFLRQLGKNACGAISVITDT